MKNKNMNNIFKKRYLVLFAIVLVLISSASVNALINSYDIRGDIFNEKTVFEINIDYAAGVHEEIIIPKDCKVLSVDIDGEKKTPLNNIEVNNAKQIKIIYMNYDSAKKDSFVENFNIFEDVKKFHLKIVLPENAKLKKSLNNNELTSSIIFPANYEIKSDGRLIYLEWNFNNLKKGEQNAFYINYEVEKNYLALIVSILFLIAIGYILIITLKRKKRSEKEKRNEEKNEENPKIIEKDKYEEHLKEDELQIVQILKKKEGQTDQGTLRVITGFSKAYLSRILSELESRKIVYKEKRGRKNRVFLK